MRERTGNQHGRDQDIVGRAPLFIYCAVTPTPVRLSQGRLWPTLLIATAFIDRTLPLADLMFSMY